MSIQIFISYAVKDEKLLWCIEQRLGILIKKLDENISVWDSTKITSGEKWDGEIKKAIEASQIAVLLITENYLNSEYIRITELPLLLRAAEEKRIRFLWIKAQPLAKTAESEIGKYQALNSTPLSELDQHAQIDKIWELCSEICAQAQGATANNMRTVQTRIKKPAQRNVQPVWPINFFREQKKNDVEPAHSNRYVYMIVPLVIVLVIGIWLVWSMYTKNKGSSPILIGDNESKNVANEEIASCFFEEYLSAEGASTDHEKKFECSLRMRPTHKEGFFYVIGPGEKGGLQTYLTNHPASWGVEQSNRAVAGDWLKFPIALHGKDPGPLEFKIIFSRERLTQYNFLEEPAGYELRLTDMGELEKLKKACLIASPAILGDKFSFEIPMTQDLDRPVLLSITHGMGNTVHYLGTRVRSKF